MKLLVVNPNTTVSMTRKIEAAARAAAHPETEIIATNAQKGPASIQGYLDVSTCVPGLLEVVSQYPDADAIVVACFDDTGVDAVRCVTSAPVIGVGEAAYHAASMISPKFSVITTLSRSLAGLEANLLRYGLDRRCVRVRASDVPVLKLEENDPKTVDKIRSEIRAAINEDRAEAIVLGCAGMTDLMSQLSEEFGLPVVDGVACAVAFSEALVKAKLTTSKLCSYA
ncbi:Hydantoin racemase [Ruegeria denitrificans]|uniref:Hydantoin racemase n=1 Tax=Ruegeria denitrificans TaxID=1715692 RepID=A0A0P1I912_9RHOB|nr:aspartate/glutamate racemase family protein [Ruegeria denitrificans]CUJ98485.1 Hydantoin racemase [Ruegeria denitrificans]